jgi:O-antigen/teichoic acid export membrane protein
MLVKNIYIRVAANILSAAINFIPFILIVRIYGAEVWGNVIYYYSIAGMFSIFSDLGFSTAYNKFIAAEDNPKDIFAFVIIKIILILIYIIAFITWYFLKFSSSSTDNVLLMTVFGIVLLELIAQFFAATMIGKRDFFYLSVVEVVSSLGFFVYTVYICFWGRNLYLLAASKAVVPLLSIVGGCFYFKKKRLYGFFVSEFGVYKKYMIYSLPIAFSSICERMISYLGNLTLGRLLGFEEVGLYQMALKCYAFVDRLVKPVTNTIFTEIVHRINNTEKFFHEQFKDLVEMLNFFGGLIILPMIFASTPVVQVFFGQENTRAAFILQVSALSVLGRLFWRPYNNVIFAIEKHKLICILEPFTIAGIIGCYYLLIPMKIGNSFYLGAAAMPITEFITWVLPVGFLRIWILKKQYGNIHMLQIILKIWFPLAIAGSLVFLSKSIFMLPLAIFIFLTIEYYLKVITAKRIRVLLVPFKQILGN